MSTATPDGPPETKNTDERVEKGRLRSHCSTALTELTPLSQQPRGHTEAGQEIVRHRQPSFHCAAARHGTVSACALE